MTIKKHIPNWPLFFLQVQHCLVHLLNYCTLGFFDITHMYIYIYTHLYLYYTSHIHVTYVYICIYTYCTHIIVIYIVIYIYIYYIYTYTHNVYRSMIAQRKPLLDTPGPKRPGWFQLSRKWMVELQETSDLGWRPCFPTVDIQFCKRRNHSFLLDSSHPPKADLMVANLAESHQKSSRLNGWSSFSHLSSPGSSTFAQAATFFFGSIFRMTAASHSPHWCTMRHWDAGRFGWWGNQSPTAQFSWGMMKHHLVEQIHSFFYWEGWIINSLSTYIYIYMRDFQRKPDGVCLLKWRRRDPTEVAPSKRLCTLCRCPLWKALTWGWKNQSHGTGGPQILADF